MLYAGVADDRRLSQNGNRHTWSGDCKRKELWEVISLVVAIFIHNLQNHILERDVFDPLAHSLQFNNGT